MSSNICKFFLQHYITFQTSQTPNIPLNFIPFVYKLTSNIHIPYFQQSNCSHFFQNLGQFYLQILFLNAQLPCIDYLLQQLLPSLLKTNSPFQTLNLLFIYLNLDFLNPITLFEHIFYNSGTYLHQKH